MAPEREASIPSVPSLVSRPLVSRPCQGHTPTDLAKLADRLVWWHTPMDLAKLADGME
jgi:hypothetical protein